MTKASSLKAMLLLTKFGLIINISRLNKTKRFKPNFFGRSKFYILYKKKYIYWNFLKSGKFLIFFIYYCWSKTLQKKDK